MIDRAPWQGHRVEGWSYDVLDLNDRVVGVLADVDENSPGSISRSVYTSPRDTATLTLTRRAPWDWTQHRVRITHVLHTAAGEVRHPVLTGTVSAPVEDHTDEAVQIALELSDKTGLLAGDQPSGSYGLAAGTSVSGAVRALIASTGDTGTLIGGSVEALALPMMWDAGTTKLRIANDLLDAGGFYALYCDGRGSFRADTYVPPDQRGTAWVFDRGYLPTWQRDADVYAVPNRVTVVGRSDDPKAPAPVAVAEDYNSDYGFNRRRRWVSVTETGIEATSLAQLQAICDRKLVTAQQVTEKIKITHPWLPIELNEVVEVQHPRLPSPARCVVWKQSINLSLGGLTTSTMRRVR